MRVEELKKSAERGVGNGGMRNSMVFTLISRGGFKIGGLG